MYISKRTGGWELESGDSVLIHVNLCCLAWIMNGVGGAKLSDDQGDGMYGMK